MLPTDTDSKLWPVVATVFLGWWGMSCWVQAYEAFTVGTVSARGGSVNIQEASGGDPRNFGIGMILLGGFFFYGLYRYWKWWLNDAD